MLEFADTVEVASSTPRVALAPVVQDLQRIKRDVADIPAPSCARSASNLIIRGMDGVVNGFVDFMADVSDTLAQRELEQGLLDITNGTEQLAALASGQATPVPRALPTSTPVPTPFPTPTPLPAGSPFVIEDFYGNPWQIRVTEVLVADTLGSTVSSSVVKASGRFVIVFMEVTNRGLSPSTFIAFGTVDVQDASGRRFEENNMATFYAQNLYGTDLCAHINPDQTMSCVAVYDVSQQSSYYLLVPGTLADPYAPRVLLDVP